MKIFQNRSLQSVNEDFEKFLERSIRGSNRTQKGIKKPRRRGLKIFQNRSLQSVNEDFEKFSERSIRGFFMFFYYSPANIAAAYSRFIRAILLTEIPFGHSASHASVFVHAPNPCSSCTFNMFVTRILASAFPCGNKAY